MLDLQLGGLPRQLARLHPAHRLPLVQHEAPGAVVGQAAHGCHGQPLVQLDGCHRVACAGLDEGLLEAGMRHRLLRGGEAGAELRPGGAHLQVAEDRLAPPDAAGHEHWHAAQVRQYLLRQHRQRHGPDVPARLRPLDDQRVGAGAHQPPGQHQRRGEADQPRAAVLHRPHRGTRRHPAGQHDMADPRLQADLDQVGQPGVHGDEVDAERRGRARLGRGDLGSQGVRPHGAAGDHPEAAGVGDGGDQGALAHPAHGAAHDGGAAAQEGHAGRPQPVKLRAGAPQPRVRLHQQPRRDVRRHQGRRRCAARAPPAPCTRRRPARRP